MSCGGRRSFGRRSVIFRLCAHNCNGVTKTVVTRASFSLSPGGEGRGENSPKQSSRIEPLNRGVMSGSAGVPPATCCRASSRRDASATRVHGEGGPNHHLPGGATLDFLGYAGNSGELSTSCFQPGKRSSTTKQPSNQGRRTMENPHTASRGPLHPAGEASQTPVWQSESRTRDCFVPSLFVFQLWELSSMFEAVLD